MIELRDYQLAAIEGLRQGIPEGHRVQALILPTGGGKTVVGAHLAAEANAKMSRTYFVCDRIPLIDQTSAMFDAFSIGHGIIQSDHWRWRPYERVQIASVQTLQRRGIDPNVKLLIIDECHTLHRAVLKFIETHPAVKVVGLTATPFTKGMGKVYTRAVNVTTTNKLIAEGYLAPVKAYAAKQIDMKGARLKFNGEWADDEIEKRGIAIVGDVVHCWLEKTQHHFGGPVKTLLFSATVAHGNELVRQFQDAGFNFQQISYKDGNDDRRRDLIEEFRRPDSDIVGLVSCEALAKGFDVPSVLCGVSCRPYRKSLSGHIQQLGRVMRPYPGKEFALWLDHAGNYLRFAADTARVFEYGVDDLDDCDMDSRARSDPNEEELDNACQGCGFILGAKDLYCPSCGKERPRRLNVVTHKPGELVDVSLSMKAEEKNPWMKDRDAVWRQICGYALLKKEGDVEAAERFAKAQYRNMYNAWPRQAMRNITATTPSPEVAGYIKHQIIRWAKSKARENRT